MSNKDNATPSLKKLVQVNENKTEIKTLKPLKSLNPINDVKKEEKKEEVSKSLNVLKPLQIKDEKSQTSLPQKEVKETIKEEIKLNTLKKINIEEPKKDISNIVKENVKNDVKNDVKEDVKEIKNEVKTLTKKEEQKPVLNKLGTSNSLGSIKLDIEPEIKEDKKVEKVEEPKEETATQSENNKEEKTLIKPAVENSVPEMGDDNLLDKVIENSHGLTSDEISKMPFSEILKVILKDKDVTDVSYNGQDVYVQHNKKGRYKFSSAVSNTTIENFVKDVANPLNEYFNVEHPILDCEIPDIYSPTQKAVLRLNAVHESISPYGNTAAIRITQPELRLTRDDRVFASEQIFDLIETMIRGNLNILISGRTGSGKTELQKYLVGNIRDAETIVLIEDTKDTDLKDLYPKKNISSWITNNKIEPSIDFDTLIRASLRNNPDWIIISETRGSEAYSMIKSGLSGHKIITTLHSDSAESNIDRLIHMCKEKYDLDQKLLGKMITNVFDIGIHIDYDITTSGTKRYICEIVEYRDYTDRGVVTNPIFTLKLQPVKQKDGTLKYERVGINGKISKELFDKLAKKKVLSNNIEQFIEEDYYENGKQD